MLIQLVALIAVAFFAVSFHAKKRVDIIRLQVGSLLLWVVHFSLLSAWTAVGLLSLNIAVAIICMFKEKYAWARDKKIFFVSIAVFLLLMVIMWKGYHDSFAFLGIFFITIARWQDTPKRVRYFSIPASMFWIIYDYFVGSYGGILAEIFMIVSAIASLRKKSQN